MTLKEKMRSIAAWIEGNEKARQGLVLLQTLAGLCAALGRGTTWCAPYADYGFWVFMGTVLSSAVLTMCFYRRYDLNILYLRKESGNLYDKTLQISNVALRRWTANTILETMEGKTCPDDVHNLGVVTGKNFVETYCNVLRNKNKDIKTCEALLRHILQYDSSSGMGKFEIVTCQLNGGKRWVEMVIKNPFAESPTDKLSPFIAGYLVGICNEVCNASFNCSVRSKYTEGQHDVYTLRIEE